MCHWNHITILPRRECVHHLGVVMCCNASPVQASQTGAVCADQHMYGHRSDSGVRVGGEAGGPYPGHPIQTSHH